MQNCTKCGKEIPDGENKLCDECKNSLLTDLGEEKETEKDSFKVSKEKKTKKDSKKKKNPVACLLIIIVILIVLIACLEVKTGAIQNLVLGYNKVGITIGNNNNNCGYATKQGNWIYYMTLSDDALNININKIKTDGTDSQLLAQKDWEIYSINAYKNYLYFIAFEPTTDDNTYQNNKIYKMSLDGKELRVINDNHFSDDCQTIYVVKDRVYYIGEDYNIYSMDLEGGDRKLVNDNGTGYIGVTDKYILFNDYPENPQSQTDFVTYIMNLDGTDIRIVNGSRLYNPNIVGDEIYYVNGDNSEIHKTDVNGKNDTLIYQSPAYNMNVSGDYIYYLNYKNEDADSEDEVVCVHKVKLDGTEHSIIYELENYSSFIDVAGDWVYYTDHNDDNYFIKMTKTDGSETVVLYDYHFEPQTYTETYEVEGADGEVPSTTASNTVVENTSTTNTNVTNTTSGNTSTNTTVNNTVANNTTTNTAITNTTNTIAQ